MLVMHWYISRERPVAALQSLTVAWERSFTKLPAELSY